MALWIPKIEYDTGPTTITFDYPVKGKDVKGEGYKFMGAVSISKSGLEQTMTDHIEIMNDLNFSHVSESIKNSLITFLTTWAYLGKEFKYYPDKDEATFYTVTIPKNGRNVKPKIHTWNTKVSPKTPMYKFKLRLRRVV